jgi:hypothetical protein
MSGLAGAPELVSRLSKAGVEFIVVGGLAALAHGASRLTQDIDVVYARHDTNLGRIVKALQPLKPYLRGAPPGLPFEWSARTLKRGLNFTLTTSGGDIDLLGEIAGGGAYEDLRPHSVQMRIFGRDTLVIDLPWLIKVKRAAGRVKDLEAIAELEVLRELRDRT